MKRDDCTLLVKKYRRQVLQCSALAVTVMCACGVSYIAGRYSGRQKAPATAGSEGETEKTTSRYTDLPPESPSFLFPPGVAFREAAPSNVDIIDSQVLNLVHLYEDGADSADPADSYAGRLYDMLALRDASQISGLYDLYSYTPQQLASLLGLSDTAVTSPSGIISEFRSLSVHFVNSGLQEAGSTPSAREIVSIINTLHYCGVLKDMETMEDYADKLWNASHKYSISMGSIYHYDGSYLYEATAGQPAVDRSGARGAGEAATVVPAFGTSCPETAAFDTALLANSRARPGHVNCTVLTVLGGTEEADSLFRAADSLEAVKTSGQTGQNTHIMNMTGVLPAQDWPQEYGFYTVNYPVKELLDSREIEQYMGLIPEDASQRREDFVRYAPTSVSKTPYYQESEPSALGYIGNSFGSLAVPDKNDRILKGLDCSS